MQRRLVMALSALALVNGCTTVAGSDQGGRLSSAPLAEACVAPTARPPAEMKLLAIPAGSIAGRAAFAVEGGSFEDRRTFNMGGILVQHPKGNLLFDTGFGIHVDDHVEALQIVMRNGLTGNTYCLGSGVELDNREVVRMIASAAFPKQDCNVRFTKDRPTDDRRYAVDTTKAISIGFRPKTSLEHFTNQIKATADWYATHKSK